MTDIQHLFCANSTFDLIECTLNLDFESILDIGFGYGGASVFYTQNNKKVTSIGILDHYDPNYVPNLVNQYNISSPINCKLEDFNPPEKFDAVLMSHILEHIINPGIFLEKARSLLKDDGWLFLIVPPYSPTLTDDHIITGWNLGSVMYILLRSGFDIKNGHFIRHGYNICAFVRKRKGDLHIPDMYDMSKRPDLWPIDTYFGIDGDFKKINWFDNFNPKYNSADFNLDFNAINLKLASLAKDFENKDIYFYGAGKIANELVLKCPELQNLNLKGFIDRDINKKSQRIGNYTIYHFNEFTDLNPDILAFSMEYTGVVTQELEEIIYKNKLKTEILTDLLCFKNSFRC